MKRLTIELTDAAYARLKSMVGVSRISDQGSPLGLFADSIFQALERGEEVKTFKTREERDKEEKLKRS